MKYKLTKAFYPEYENLKDEYTLETTKNKKLRLKLLESLSKTLPVYVRWTFGVTGRMSMEKTKTKTVSM
jgi:hypothetical protein